MKPNFLMISSDQHRYDCIGINGNSTIQTPNLDRLAGQGFLFSNAYTTCPVCTPARASFLNGQWSYVHGCLTIPEHTEPQCALPLQTPMVPRLLREAGYCQSYIGKWHLGRRDNSAYHPSPIDVGMDSYIPESEYGNWCRENHITSARFSKAGSMEPREDELNPRKVFQNRIDPIDHTQSRLHWGADQTIEQMKMLSKQEKPFFLRWDPSEPHLPSIVPRDFAEKYRAEDIPLWGSVHDELVNKPYALRKLRNAWGLNGISDEEIREMIRLYYAEITLLDYEIGRVLQSLEELGLAENTVVIYTTDHGDMCGSHGFVDKHYNMYEDITHVPLILRCPGETPAQKDMFVHHTIDLAYTILQLAGIKVPETFQGASLLSDNGRSFAVSAYHGAQFGLFSQRMLRQRRYKYVYNATDIDELYDLQNDPWEMENLIFQPEQQERIAQMRRDLYLFLKDSGDPLMASMWPREELFKNKKLER